MQLGGTTKNLERAYARNPQKMAELAELFRELGMPSGRKGRAYKSRMVMQEQAGFPILKRKHELIKIAQMTIARKTAGEVMALMFPPPPPPEVVAQAKEVAQKETVKKVVPWALAAGAAGLLYFIL